MELGAWIKQQVEGGSSRGADLGNRLEMVEEEAATSVLPGAGGGNADWEKREKGKDL